MVVVDKVEEVDGEAVLRRYMDLAKFAALLQSGSFFHCKMSNFDDGLEGGLTADDYITFTNDLAYLDLTMALWPVVQESQEERQVRLDKVERIRSFVDQETFETIFGPMLKSNAVEYFERARRWVYVSCWNKAQTECAGMWSLYGADNSICICTTVNQVSKYLQFDGLEVTKSVMAEVDYLDHGEGSFSDQELGAFVSKAEPFGFEKEIRVIAWNSSKNYGELAQDNPHAGVFSRSVDLNLIINKIVVSPKADGWFKSVVEKLCTAYGLNVEIEYSSLLSPRISHLVDTRLLRK
ncbi:hypothetical protein [Pseudomonas serbica]